MECDSVHSAIEKQKQKTDVNLPMNYVEIIKKARSKSNYGKYDAKYLDLSFFRDYKACDIKTLKPSIKVGPPYVPNIRQVCHKPESTISFNLTYDDSQWEPLPYTITLRHRTPKQLYTAPLKIAFSKWTHLQEIKLTINKQYRSFYDNLAHHPKPNKKDYET